MKITIELDDELIRKVACDDKDALEDIVNYIYKLCNAVCEEPIGMKTEVDLDGNSKN